MKKSYLIMAIMAFSFLGLVTSFPESNASLNADITFWTTEVEASRIATINKIASRFTGATVEVVAVDENELPEQITTALANDNLPDVVQMGFEFVGGYVDQGILDAEAATTVATSITDLGGLPLVANPKTTGASDKYGAVPVDGWVQGIWYRKDLFTDNSLSAPTSYANIEAAAKKLHNLTDFNNPMYGIVMGTDPKAVYTQQCYEHIALANGARALDTDGNVALYSDEQVEAIEWYADIASKYAPKGFNDWSEANQLYLTGKAAMIFYSTFIADDMLGLQARDWIPIADLGDLTGFAPDITGLHGETASYGQISALGIGEGAHASSGDFIKHILTGENYLDWIHMAITGKMPLIQTTAVLDNWTQNQIFSEFPGLAPKILDGFKNVARWGLIDGNSYSTDIATLYGELLIPKAIVEVISNISDAETALQNAEDDFKIAIGQEDAAASGFGIIALLGAFAAIGIVLRKRK